MPATTTSSRVSPIAVSIRSSSTPTGPVIQPLSAESSASGRSVRIISGGFFCAVTGTRTAFGPYEVCHEAYDNSNHEDSRGTLVGFVSDRFADEMFRLSPEERKARILDSMAQYYGDEARNPVVYYESDWGTEEWTRGAYAASFDLGGLVRYGADLRKAVGPMHFACSDLAGLGYQHVDGAIRMGRLVAGQIAEQLG